MANQPTQWGSTQLLIPPYFKTKVNTKCRLIDVRLPTTKGGWASRDCTLYTSAKSIIAEGEAFISPTAVHCNLQTGMGGLTQNESFNMPGVGRSIHMVCDSIRLDVEISPSLTAQFQVSANVGIGGLYPGKTQVPLQTIGPLTPPFDEYFIDIPNYCTQYKLEAPNPQAVLIEPYYNTSVLLQESINGLLAVDFISIPIMANRFRLTSGIQQAVYMTFIRPS